MLLFRKDDTTCSVLSHKIETVIHHSPLTIIFALINNIMHNLKINNEMSIPIASESLLALSVCASRSC